jgi:hypothetical protein
LRLHAITELRARAAEADEGLVIAASDDVIEKVRIEVVVEAGHVEVVR